MKNFCASCIGVNVEDIISTDNDQLPKWLEKFDYVTNFIKQSKVVPYKQKYTKMKLKLKLDKTRAGQYILYWGAQPYSKRNDMLSIQNAKQAYNNFTNYGVSKIGKNGDVTFYFNCPQPYSTIEKNKTKPETYYRHIHFCYSNKNNNQWINKVYTKVVICDVSLQHSLNLLYSNQAIMINALPCEYYSKSHIPHSYNLGIDVAKTLSKKGIVNWIDDIIKFNYNTIYNAIKNKKINLYEIPIIVYCQHSKCDAAHKLAILLLKAGFVNILYYKGGMEQYLLSKNKTKKSKRKTQRKSQRKSQRKK